MHKRALYGSNWLGHFGWVWPFPRILGRCIHAGQAMIAIVGSCKNGESRYPGRYLAPNSLPTDCRIPAGHRLDADRAGGPIQSLQNNVCLLMNTAAGEAAQAFTPLHPRVRATAVSRSLRAWRLRFEDAAGQGLWLAWCRWVWAVTACPAGCVPKAEGSLM